MGRIIITRKKEIFNGLRNIDLYIDNIKVATIANGQSNEINIPDGNEHKLVAKIDWCTSNAIVFNVIENQIKQIELSSFKNAKYIFPIFVFTCLTHFILKHTIQYDSLFLLVSIPMCLYLLYFITIKKNQYLVLSENN
jgi:hypothetical protein